jgi:hypothetical protein
MTTCPIMQSLRLGKRTIGPVHATIYPRWNAKDGP